MTRHDADSTLYALCWCMALPIILSSVIGLSLGQPDPLASDLRLPGFLAVRPISSEDLVVAKLKVAAATITFTWFLVLAYTVIWLKSWANTNQLSELWDALVAMRGLWPARLAVALAVLGLGCLTFRALAADLWSGLCGRRVIYFTSAALRLCGIVVLVLITISFVRHFRSGKLELYFNGAFWLLLAAVIVKFWSAAFTWKNISRARSRGFSLLWLCATACIAFAALIFCPKVVWLRELCLLAALCIMPLARLGFAPLSLSLNRHR